jgi:hypothetical protein
MIKERNEKKKQRGWDVVTLLQICRSNDNNKF